MNGEMDDGRSSVRRVFLFFFFFSFYEVTTKHVMILAGTRITVEPVG